MAILKSVEIVPSHEVKLGETPADKLKGTISKARCIVALTLWNSHSYDMMIMTGGIIDHEVQKEPMAITMRNWIISQLNPDRTYGIIAEPDSLDTWQNVEFCVQAIERRLHLYGKDQIEITVATEESQFRRIAHTLRAYGYRHLCLADSGVNIGFWRKLWEWCLYLLCLWDPKGKGIIIYLNRWRRRQK